MIKTGLKFADINPYIDVNIRSPKENINSNKKWVNWGDSNDYPQYLDELYHSVPSLKSVVDCVCNFVLGNSINCNIDFTKCTTDVDNFMIETLIENMVKSYCIYGGILLEIHRNVIGKINGLFVLDMKNVRINKEKDTFYYTPDFSSKVYISKSNVVELPKYNEYENNRIAVLYFNNNGFSTNVYPAPIYESAIKSCEIEKSIDDFHLNAIKNGFVSSAIFNMNNGVPNAEDQDEIAAAIEEKFSGENNAGRIMVSFNDDADHKMEVETIDPTDFSERYNTLAERCRQQIFMAWRVTPNILGVPTETTGFNSQEYSSAYKIFEKNVVVPTQKIITRILKKIGVEINIEKYSIDFGDYD